MSDERDYLGELTAQEHAEVLKHLRTLMQWQMYFLPGDCIQALRKVTELLCGRFPDIEIEVNSLANRHHEYTSRLRESEQVRDKAIKKIRASELVDAALAVIDGEGINVSEFISALGDEVCLAPGCSLPRICDGTCMRDD